MTKLLRIAVMENKLCGTFKTEIRKTELGFHNEAVPFNGDDPVQMMRDLVAAFEAWESAS